MHPRNICLREVQDDGGHLREDKDDGSGNTVC
jgi:hypothetical protein